MVFSSSMAPYLLPGKHLAPQRVLFDMVDLDSDKWLQYSGLAGLASAWIYRREARKLLELERQAAANFAVTYLVSAHEVESFAQLAPESEDRIRAFCNGVNLEYFAPGVLCLTLPRRGHAHRHDRSYGLLAQCRRGAVVRPRGTAPGQAQDFRRALLCRGRPAGRGAAQFLGPDVEITGEVADIRPYVAAARVVVAPLRIARGVQNKVLEAMAMGAPTVATEQASRALAVSSGREILVASSATDFADAVVRAAGAAGREIIAANGRSYVERNHDWNHLLSAFDAALLELKSWRKDGAQAMGAE